MPPTILSELFIDDPVGAALDVDIRDKIVVTRSIGTPYLLDVLAKHPRALIVREDIHSVEVILSCIGLRGGESMFLGPAMNTNYPPLTHCERRILQFVAHGLSNVQIAGKIGRSVNTINSQVSSILQKMGAVGRRHAQNLYWGHDLHTYNLDK